MDEKNEVTFDEYDEIINPPSQQCDFDRVLQVALSRRDLLKGVVAVGGVATLGSIVSAESAIGAESRFAFSPIEANTLDEITLPDGYISHVVVRWGDPLWSDVADFDHATRGTAKEQLMAFGDNVDGMEVFSHNGHNLLVTNNEYTNRSIIWGNRPEGLAETDDDVLKGKLAHGLTVVEIKQDDGAWSIVKDSPFNRRVTPDAEMAITGPAAGHDLMKTQADPSGTLALGTWNNCGNGATPWGTYLACEENFNGYFSAEDENHEVSPELQRYGVSASDWGYGWARIDERFNVEKHPNEPNRAGYVVELDPRDPDSVPKKRTALGRFKHENAEVVINTDGRIVVYMGDDERGEFLYRFVSDGVYAPGGETDALLEEGSLYAAKFNDDGSGEWPEWVAANPNSAEVYVALTNNVNRGVKPNSGGDPTPVNGPNPREGNVYGQIVRWRPDGADHTSNAFSWDIYLLAGNPTVATDAADLNAGSDNISEDNMFNSPDGLKFDSHGLLWVQTDGNYSNAEQFAGQGNNQMLAADPSSGEVKRFLVGPNECEVTGLTWSADRRTMFVGIQHPGEKGNSHWPEGGEAVPRSAVIAIQRKDGTVVG